MGYRVINGKLYPVGNFSNYGSEVKTNKSDEKESASFEKILKTHIEKNESFTISNHAAERLKNISFNKSDMQNINEAINKAKGKDSKNCLILYKDVALVTSIENRTIITAVEKERAKDNVFTNIDSVVIL